nr:unnamed protein product [Callosobruchus chinensis]
MQSRAGQFD